MSSWIASAPVPPAWSDLCAQSGMLFHGEEWLALLERGFSCSSMFFLDEERRHGAAITQFRAGPFRIGYLGFPVGGMVGSAVPTEDLVNALRQAWVAQKPVAVRIPVSGFGESVELNLPYESTLETAIVDLQSWTLAGIPKNRRRDVNKSLRSGLDLVEASDPADAERIYELYRKTLERKDGSLRYTADYFSALVELARRHPNLRVLLAKKDNSIAAFTVVALHGSVAYYLHGAYDWSHRESLPSAMLLNEAIEWAKARGCESFNLMSSPKGQESLVKYKERWGAETREHRTYTVPVSSLAYSVFKLAERLYRIIQ